MHNYFYDAENRLIQVDGSLGDCSSTTTLAHATACYYYDANGRRVWRTGFTNDTCDSTGQRRYVYDLAGHWLSSVNKVSGTGCRGEIYAGSRHVATNPGGDTTLDHTDWLGTSRVRTDWQYTSSHGFWLGQSCTSLPFGDGLDCNSPNYFSLHFTGKERDSESGLDNFGARYNSSSMGRFMSADPKHVSAHLFDPQTLNRYAYTRNNPLAYVDPNGRDLEKAWKDVNTFANSIYVRVSIGLGAELKATRGPVEAKVGAAYKANAETSQDAILKISKSADAGLSAGTENHTVFGKSRSVEQTVLTLQNDRHLTGEEPPVVTTGDKVGPANASEDKLGIGLEGGVVVVGGGEVGATREGLNALKDAASEVKDSLTNPGPPPPPRPPQPPPCTADKDKKCN